MILIPMVVRVASVATGWASVRPCGVALEADSDWTEDVDRFMRISVVLENHRTLCPD